LRCCCFPCSCWATGDDHYLGGVLAQLRTEYNLGQSDLGEIDPASEAMKLATMGLRPVAVITLWEKANEYKMKEDWDNLSATTESDHQTAAEFHFGLGIPGTQPGVQRFGRIRRLPSALPLGETGHQFL
jgi:hypothetical protein